MIRTAPTVRALMLGTTLAVLTANPALAAGVRPAVASLRSVPIPSQGPAGFAITIINTNSDSADFLLKVQSPAGIFESKVKGYRPIPDSSFVTLPVSQVRVGPHDSVMVPVSYNIPNDPRYFNQTWLCIIVIEATKAADAHVLMGFTTGAICQLLLETKSNSAVKRPDGIPAIKPLWSTHDDVTPSDLIEAPFTVYNNDSLAHSYRPSLYVRRDRPENASASAPMADIDTIPGYVRYDRADLVSFTPETFGIKRGGEEHVVAHLKVPPEYAKFGWNSEAILMVTDDKNRTAFVRCFMDLKK